MDIFAFTGKKEIEDMERKFRSSLVMIYSDVFAFGFTTEQP